ncbi:uncharacterized protein LOC124272235 [Haliotis rubra]|uniref:uncharacterized protein LOC124272235 n=1 Tax=Haliotis rubra TaxID=36100 RepID=UPI001EE5CD93|nr:uncharacterized protein LOC124272235 [Haliotis rubra]
MMAQKSVDVKRVAFSSEETFDDTFLKVKDILDSQVYLHEVMMRSSELYKTIYMDMLEKTKALEGKLQPMSPAFLKWLTDYTHLIGSFSSAQEQTSETATTQKTVVAKKKKRSRKMEDDLFQPSVKKPKKQQVKKAKVMDKNSSQPSLVIEPISPPPTEANLDVSSEVNLFVDEDTLVADCQSTTPNDWWQDYNQLMEDIEQQESNAVEDDPYEEHKLTPLQKNLKRKEEGPSVELQMTSETQSTVEKADAKERRRKSLKRAAGEQIITTKRIRQTENTTPSKTANVLMCTPVAGNDIFS